MTQAQMFPMTEEERIAMLRRNLAIDVEKRKARRDTAASSLDEAQEGYEEALGLLAAFDNMVQIVAQGARLADVESITAEDASDAPPPNISVVIVLYPGDDEPHVTKIGEHTRYSELVADYLADARLDDAIDRYRVISEDEGFERELSAAIGPDDYGKRLLVELVAPEESEDPS